ncbi:MAG: hypothetical protein RRY36_00555 [Bacteroidaceae bacterium]
MNKKIIIRIATTSVFILLFVGINIYFFSRLSNKQVEKEMDLFCLVPPSSVAVLETTNVDEFISDINKQSCKNEYKYLHLSDLLEFVKNNFNLIMENSAHGLSRQMGKMLISFHHPGSTKDQVLYCQMNDEDKSVIESILQKHNTTAFPAKQFSYKGENIYIYPLDNDRFLACYYHKGFLAVSYQKRLIEEVIDTYLSKHSILSNKFFALTIDKKRANNIASLYVRTNSMLTDWTQFDIKMNGDAIYFSGISFGQDNIPSFENALKAQQPIKRIQGKMLPQSTYFYSQLSLSNIDKMIPSSIQKKDSSLYNFIKENTAGEMCDMMFYKSDTEKQVYSMATISLIDDKKAEQDLKLICVNYPYTKQKNKFYTLPSGNLLLYLMGKPKENSETVCCLYRNRLLVAAKDSVITSYIQYIEEGKVMENNIIFKECQNSLALEANYATMADMREMVYSSKDDPRLLTNFFSKHITFFQYFVIAMQCTVTDNIMYPNITLIYKGHENINR